MVMKFEEFLNEGLISDYKKQEEAANREISNGDKTFVLDALKRFDEIGIPYVFTCKSCGIISENVDDSKASVDRDKVYRFSEIEDDGFKEIHITERSVLKLLDEDSECIENDVEYKNVWKSIYKWFDKAYEKMELNFDGKIKVEKLIELKNDIKKEVF